LKKSKTRFELEIMKEKRRNNLRRIGFFQLVTPAGAVIDRFEHTWVMSTQSLEITLLVFGNSDL